MGVARFSAVPMKEAIWRASLAVSGAGMLGTGLGKNSEE
jgi:imidazoleglycerol phosphate dehydratase HisB